MRESDRREETGVYVFKSTSALVEVSGDGPRSAYRLKARNGAQRCANNYVAFPHPELLVALPPRLGLEDPLEPAHTSSSPCSPSSRCSAGCEALEVCLAHLPAGPPSYLGCARGDSHAHAELSPGSWISTWTWHKLLGCSCQSSCPGLAALHPCAPCFACL